jgi:ABC-type bacteriocin/lantibiotic exporter with double-glycine peptidase domain
VQSQKPDQRTNENSKNCNVETVSLVDVSFRYPSASELLLSDVNMTLQRGDFVGITGGSGEGKSTLVDLIIGLLEPTEGKILINGIRSVEFLENNPGVIAYVPQSCGLLDGSILENILYRKNYQEYEVVEVINALKAARLWDFVSALPLGIQTNIGERGSLLSGGQKQRLGIARGLVQKSSLIVLDESTNALDLHTESQIYEILNELRDEITVIIIGHNFETIKLNANKLFLVENRTVTELFQK